MSIILFGWSGSAERLAPLLKLEPCPHCEMNSILWLGRRRGALRLYFVPVAQWDRAYFVSCNACDAGFEIDMEAGRRLHRAYRAGRRMTTEKIRTLLAPARKALGPGR